MNIRIALLALTLLCSGRLLAQDSSLTHVHVKGIDIDMNLAGGWYKQNSTTNDPNGVQHVYIPAGLPRRQHDPGIRNAWDLDNDVMTDNPLRHGCVYMDIALRARIGKELKLYTDIIGEHRGFSGGDYNTANLVVYPKVRLEYKRDFSLFKQSFSIGFLGGSRDSLRQLEGLTIYNMDVDNATLYLQWKHLRYTASQIGDMLFTGLGIDDQIMDMLSLEALPLGPKWKTDIRLANTANTGYNVQFHVDLSAGFYLPGGPRLYAQVSKRMTEEPVNAYATLAGGRYRWQRGRVSVNSFLEARYYDAAFNSGYIYEGVYYRPKTALHIATDFVGPFLYPLINFERPYSKWAVYAEYQNRNVTALNAYADAKCRLFDHFFANVLLDINYISPEGLDAYWLPFYRAGIGYEVLRDNIFLVSLTNKSINLDKHYQDFYLTETPSVQIQFMRTFSWD